MLSVMAYITG